MAQSTMTRVSLRNIMAHKLRLALTVLAVVLGTAFISGSFMFTNSLSSTFDSAVSNSFTGVDAAVSPKGERSEGISAEQREELANDPEVRAVNIASQETVVVANEQSEAFQTGGGTSALYPYYSEEKYVGEPNTLIEGNAPVGPEQVIVSKGGAEAHGIAVGDKLIVVDSENRTSVEVTGIYEPAMEAGVGGSILLEMDEAAFLERYHPDGLVDQLKVSGANGDPQALVQHLNDTYDIEAEEGEVLAERLSEVISSALEFVNYFLIAFGLIALLVGTFIIANTFSMIVAQRTKEFALLRALGASRAQITRSVVMESVIVGLIGSSIGVVAGMGLVAGIKWFMTQQGFPMDGGLGLSANAVIIPLILGTIVTVVSAWAPARRAGSVQPVEAMRTTEQAAGSSLKSRTIIGLVMMVVGVAAAVAAVFMTDSPTKTRAIIVGIGAFGLIVGYFLAGPALSLPIVPTLGKIVGAPFGAIGSLAATNSQRNPRRTAATAFALTLGVALVTAIGMFGATMKSAVADTLTENVSADYILSGPTTGAFPTPAETPQLARDTEGVEQVVNLYTAPVSVDGTGSMAFGPHVQTMVIDANPSEMVNFKVIEGTMDFYGTPGFIATEDKAQEMGWKVGESYELAAPGLSPKTKELKLVGTFERNNIVEGIAVPADVVEDIVPAQAMTLTMVGVNGEEGYDLERLRTNLEESTKELVVVQVVSGPGMADQTAVLIDQMLSILYALLALAVIIAILGIVNTLTLGVIERRQEIGMLRAVGTHRRQVRTMITLEAVQIAIFGAVMGMGIGLLLGWSFLEVLDSSGIDETIFPWGQLLLMLAASAVVGVVAAFWPSQRAAKTPPLEAIKS